MISRQRWLRSALLVTVLLGVWTEVTRGEPRIQLTPQYPEIGGSVTLTVTGITGSIKYITWYKGPASSDVYQILAYLPGSPPTQVPGPLHHNRMEVPSSGSLRISNLNRADEGQYRVKFLTDKERDASVYLKVYEAVVKPTITSSSSQPKEYDMVTLNCTSTNAERITWSRVSGSISSGVTFQSDNKTLTWPRINRTDTGAYQCKGENPISSSVSDLYTLTVSYGPEKVMVTFGSNKQILECSAESVPPAAYSWRFNGTDLNKNQQTLHLDETGHVQEGIYECEAYNSVTKKTASNNVTVTVVEAVGKPTITSNSSEPKENDSVTLTCASSNAERITWSRVRGSISSGVTYSLDNKTLTWPRISHTDSGSYQCKGENSISNSISDPYTLTISYSTDSIPQSPIPVAIIGSVIAVVVLLILLVALIYVFIKRRKGQKDNSSAKGGTSRNGQANASATPEEPPEIQYADIVIKRMPRKQEQQPPPESVYANRAAATKPPDDNVVYSELRI